MAKEPIRILTKNWDIKNSNTIEAYIKNGGYKALEKAIKQMNPEQVMDEVKKSNLRGRGGAGFPAGVKWGFVPKDSDKLKYLCVNADEGEPGTFKDRYIMTLDPHMLLEGIAITSYAVGISAAYIYIRNEYIESIAILKTAIQEAKAKNYLGASILGSNFNLEIYVHRGAGAYIAGEETGLIESLEGKRAMPRIRPPFPAAVGVFNCPTVVNNVETIACVPSIIEHGGEWFAGIGVSKDGGTKLYAVSGHVNNPGVYELPVGTSLQKILYEHAGGIKGGELKAVIPGGISASVLAARECDIAMDCQSVAKAGSMLGSAGIIVMNNRVCMVEALFNIAEFYAEESCGQCTPCRSGSHWIKNILERILHGKGKTDDLEIMLSFIPGIMGRTICAFGDALCGPVQSFITKFRDEFEYHIIEGKCNIRNKLDIL
ncbi:MAG: NADH oxidoreductase (quinone) subunit F [Candidatus Fischerbacteria bacterium RBG_13_37_8]|uniref:NADH-quinone oxidoreductase subunit F n=1 Tax=Candidatus Fischerbacteria bacterium RBG_13_37_8 TaxID=1817863 RepID=A0A1F5VKF5_9BACT|nr:MAG: NADH oxidoreductase (quinone) subunit F [Candidatus Fischerbacteria bacterium RBG_13_37_8]